MLHLPHAPEIGAEEFVETVEAGASLHVLDVRAPFRVAAGRIDIVPSDRFHNVAGSSLIKITDPSEVGIDPSAEIAVVCGHGNDSRVLALHLNHLGFNARSLTGGMAAWMSLTVPREIPPTASLDRFIQLDRIGKGALGYLLVSDGEAIVIDPPREFEPHLLMAEELDARVVGVADTHVHADYISGASGLASYLEVPYYLHPRDAFYPYDGTPGRIEFAPIVDGDVIDFGRTSLRAVHTPGHTEGSLTYMVGEAIALTGDFLFVASVGRPDLADRTDEWAEELWGSLVRAKSDWPQELAIFPAHYSSDSERQRDRSVQGRFGSMMVANRALQFENRAEFIRWIRENKAPFPEVYRKIKAVNVGLVAVSKEEADELELGRNECALGGA